ncbi:MAG: hypothetical protein WCP26_08085 [Actinomycetes bacterium]
MTEASSMSGAEFAVRFLLIPATIIAIIWFLWALPSWLRRSSFRPGQAWTSEPLWVGAPAESGAINRAALESATPGNGTDDRGGASARW